MLADRHVREKAGDRLNALADMAAGNVSEHVAHIAGLTRTLQASFLNLADLPTEEYRGYVDILRLHAGNERLPGLCLSADPTIAATIEGLRAEGTLAATEPVALEGTSAGAVTVIYFTLL